MNKIIFTERSKIFIFKALDITVGDDGFLYKDGEIMLDIIDKKPVTEAEFCGLTKEGIIKGDLHSLISFAERTKEINYED